MHLCWFVNSYSQDGITPLHCAVTAGENCAAVVRVLAKDYHADLDAVIRVSYLQIFKICFYLRGAERRDEGVSLKD